MAHILYPKYYKHSNESCTFAVLGLTSDVKIFAILIMSSLLLLRLVFFHIFMCGTKIRIFIHVKGQLNSE